MGTISTGQEKNKDPWAHWQQQQQLAQNSR